MASLYKLCDVGCIHHQVQFPCTRFHGSPPTAVAQKYGKKTKKVGDAIRNNYRETPSGMFSPTRAARQTGAENAAAPGSPRHAEGADVP